MKKIISIMSVIAIICLTLSMSAFAATDAKVSFIVENNTVTLGETIVVTVKLTADTTNNMGIAGSSKVYPTWNPEEFEFVEATAGENTLDYSKDPTVSTDYASTGSLTFTQAYSASADKSKVAAKDFIFGTFELKPLKTGTLSIVPGSSTSVALNVSGGTAATKETLKAANIDTLTIVVTDGGSSTPEDVVLDEETFDEGASSIDVEEGATIKYGTSEITAGANAKVYTFFAKTAEALAAETYGVTAEIGGKAYKFPGKADVEAGKSWAIRFVVPAGQFSDGVAINSIDNIVAY